MLLIKNVTTQNILGEIGLIRCVLSVNGPFQGWEKVFFRFSRHMGTERARISYRILTADCSEIGRKHEERE